jgi:hypothetical protein
MFSEWTITYVTDSHNWDTAPDVHGPIPDAVVTRDAGDVVLALQTFYASAYPDDSATALTLSNEASAPLTTDGVSLIGTGWHALGQGQWAELQVRREWVYE